MKYYGFTPTNTMFEFTTQTLKKMNEEFYNRKFKDTEKIDIFGQKIISKYRKLQPNGCLLDFEEKEATLESIYP